MNTQEQRISRAIRNVGSICLLTLVFSAAIAAAPFSTDGISIALPTGFEGPVIQNQGQAKLVAFTKQSLPITIKTLLQINVFDPGPNANLATLSQEQLSAGAQKSVLEFVKGVENRRTEYSQSVVTKLLLADTPAAKITWRGNMNGVAANGVMYCVFLKGKIFSFHTQDIGNEPTPNMHEAMMAIEAVTAK